MAYRTLLWIDFTIREGELAAIVGPTGAGKSSLFHAILGEMHLTSGKIFRKGRIALVE
jgi:ABC-type Mn2+/Zn2+ transport system ATPase subunit